MHPAIKRRAIAHYAHWFPSLLQDGHDPQDPKQSPADMTAFVQNLLQQMQNRFQTMSDSIVTKNILLFWFALQVLKIC
ncbi:Heat shock factor-binding protein isoform B [Glycine soja]|uniref:Heat shock factor-binding protein isoform B n=1 Tax=Glycine soja TaxID=3848 RepID=A0A445LPB8_GLYSO|nr:Heat shock factor-binding protein isoform B [Glycine soja]